MEKVALSDIVWNSQVYPRKKWNTATINRYVDALRAGDEFPPVVLEKTTYMLLDGKHRLEAYKKYNEQYQDWLETEKEERRDWEGPVPDGTIPVEWHEIPENNLTKSADQLLQQAEALDLEAEKEELIDKATRLKHIAMKSYAASLSAKHGDRISNADLKALAVEKCEADPKEFDVQRFCAKMGISESTVYDYVGHILSREKEQRQAKALRLSMLGWTQKEIAGVLGVHRGQISKDVQNSRSGKMHIWELAKENIERHEIAKRFNLPPILIEAITLEDKTDQERLEELEVKTKPYDVWNFPSCHDLMGDKHPGRIPGELICNVLYFFTEQGDRVVDPMVGSGTTLDACLLMGRECRGYDIDERHDRVDIEKHNLSQGWPDAVKEADLIFWDPPYYDKKDASTTGEDGYIEGSISGMSPDEYLEWIGDRFVELKTMVPPGTKLVFLMSDWDSENAKKYEGHQGIFLWDYAFKLQKAGWQLTRQIQCPLPTQQVHPDIVNKFRDKKRLARLDRYLVVAENE